MTDCPSGDQLQAFNLGRLTYDEIDRVAAHLDGCSNCQDTLRTVGDNTDEMVAGFRRSADVDLHEIVERDSYASFEEKARSLVLSEHTVVETMVQPRPKPVRSPSGRQELGGYELLYELASGGMGTVYVGQHRRLKRLAAIKVLSHRDSARPRSVERFRREMEAAGALDHPNIVRALDASDQGGVPFLAMELIDGVDLSKIIRQRRLPVDAVCEIVRQTALGLSCIHENDQVHRDIKPSNLMLSTDGTVKILDLGLARIRGDWDDEITSTDQMLGTLDYMAPEQANDSRNVDIRADIYSLGCTMYKLLTGESPYADCRTPASKIAAHQARPMPLPQLEMCRDDLPAEVMPLLDKMVAKDPANRFQTPAEVAAAFTPLASLDALSRVIVDNDLPTTSEVMATLPSARLPFLPDAMSKGEGSAVRRAFPFVVAGGLVAILLAVGAVWSLSRPRSGPGPLGEIDQLEPNIWYNAIETTPADFVGPRAGSTGLVHDKRARELTLTPRDFMMVILGTAKRPRYKVKMSINPSEWKDGGVGFFFGYKYDAEKDEASYQAIQLVKTNEQTELSMRRSTHYLKFFDEGKQFAIRSIPTGPRAGLMVPVPPVGARDLEVTITPQGMTRMLWGGNSVWQFCSPDVNADGKGRDFESGAFGLLINNRNVKFQDIWVQRLK